tara:strand:- start:644 stop:1843 length:1200 start_codon:yes stop_codon:yes gene_type:complete
MKSKEDILNEIFENDPLDLLKLKPKTSSIKTSEERLLSSFEEINDFVKNNDREPIPDPTNISEYKLYSVLKGLRENDEKIDILKSYDNYNLLDYNKDEVNSMDDIFESDSFDILGDDSEGLFTFKHTPKNIERAKADFVGKRFRCKDFDQYEHQFIEVQNDLALGKRKLVDFNYENLREGEYYVNNGILLYLKDVKFEKKVQIFKSGTHSRPDGRTVIIFENGTESNIMFQSLYKALQKNGKMVTQNIDKVADDFQKSFEGITDEDKETGHIYILKSLSKKDEIASINNLYKIGFSSNSVKERIRNAENDPTYLMAPVKLVSSWMCYNMNTMKLEQLIQRFFGNTCLDIDVYDKNGKRHRPREWFIAPIEAIEQAVALIISGEIINYRFDKENCMIVEK